MELAGVVVLYHPNEEVIENIKSYICDLNILYIIDNTEAPNTIFKEKLDQVLSCVNNKYIYIAWNDNKGVSYALNRALEYCKKDKYLLTMDQDSRFPKGMLIKYKKNIEKLRCDRIAMYTVNYTGLNAEEKSLSPYEVKLAITSGSILNVTIAKQLESFDENLFIDEVDSEFCYRAQKNGYKVIVFPDIIMHHQVGNPNKHKILWRTYNVFNHSPIRKYYILRNRLYVMKKYPDRIGFLTIETIKMIIKVLLAEKEKKKNFKYMYWGITDALKNVMGKFGHNN